MVWWKKFFGLDGTPDHYVMVEEARGLIPTCYDDAAASEIPADEVTKVALRLRYLIEQCVPCELEEELVTKAHSRVITPNVLKAAKEAGGEQYASCVVYCLLINKRLFNQQAMIQIWDANLYHVRAVAAEVIAKYLIEEEERLDYLMHAVLLKRYAMIVNGEQTNVANAIERAVDLHALRVIASSGYQKTVQYLWKGWLFQAQDDHTRFVDYEEKANANYIVHVDPHRMGAPIYQNATQVIFSLGYLGLHTGAINTVNPTGNFDIIKGLLYIFTFAFLWDEIAKFWKVGKYYIGFWTIFNVLLYTVLTISLVLRFIALSYPLDDFDGQHTKFNELSYNLLAFSAPMFWIRLLPFLDTFRFFGVMLVVLKAMMKNSFIFFALLIVVIAGFLQAFISMSNADNRAGTTTFILQAMANAVMQSPDFSRFDAFAPPFGIILYYIFTFIVMIILLNILIALYNSAYEHITNNALDEYMALFAQKTMQYVRAPNANVFIAPLNLVEIFCLILPLKWWMPHPMYQRLNDYVMGFLYSPLLLVAALFETRSARKVSTNRKRGERDDNILEEWEQMGDGVDFEGEGWAKVVDAAKSNVEDDQATLEVRELRREIRELKGMLKTLLKEKGQNGESS